MEIMEFSGEDDAGWEGSLLVLKGLILLFRMEDVSCFLDQPRYAFGPNHTVHNAG